MNGSCFQYLLEKNFHELAVSLNFTRSEVNIKLSNKVVSQAVRHQPTGITKKTNTKLTPPLTLSRILKVALGHRYENTHKTTNLYDLPTQHRQQSLRTVY